MRLYRARNPNRCDYRPALVVCFTIVATVMVLRQRESGVYSSGDQIVPSTRRLQDAEPGSASALGLNLPAGATGGVDSSRAVHSQSTARTAQRLPPRAPSGGAGRLRPIPRPSVAEAAAFMRPRQLKPLTMEGGAAAASIGGWPLPFPVRVFWHIGQADTLMWGLVVKEQLERIQRSGLLDKGATVEACYVGDPNSTPVFEDKRVPVEYLGGTKEYEWATLRRLEAYCSAQPTARVLYMHTKGSTHPVTEELGWFTYNWRKLLEHMLLDNHEAVLQQLSDATEVNAAGPLLVSNEWAPLHFSGNFWAAKCSYINGLKRIDEADVSNRLGAEFYISSPDLKPKDCWTVHESDGCNPSKYGCNYEERLYRDFKGCGRPAPENAVTA